MYLVLKTLIFCLISFSSISDNLKVRVNVGKIEPLPIAIADFTDNNGKVSKVGRLISNVISNNLVNSGQFKAITDIVGPPTYPAPIQQILFVKLLFMIFLTIFFQ